MSKQLLLASLALAFILAVPSALAQVLGPGNFIPPDFVNQGSGATGPIVPPTIPPLGNVQPATGAPATGGPGGAAAAPSTGGPGGAAGGGATDFPNPLAFDTVQDVVGSLLIALQSIIVLISLVFLVIGAVLYITSGGSEHQIERAKKAIYASMIGLAIGIAAPTFLKEIAAILGWGAVPAQVAQAQGLAAILTNLLNFLLGIVGVLALIALVVGAIMYLTAAGDENRIDTGKKIVKWAIWGIVIALASMVIVRQIASFFAA